MSDNKSEYGCSCICHDIPTTTPKFDQLFNLQHKCTICGCYRKGVEVVPFHKEAYTTVLLDYSKVNPMFNLQDVILVVRYLQKDVELLKDQVKYLMNRANLSKGIKGG
jgi:hypothetical protein